MLPIMLKIVEVKSHFRLKKSHTESYLVAQKSGPASEVALIRPFLHSSSWAPMGLQESLRTSKVAHKVGFSRPEVGFSCPEVGPDLESRTGSRTRNRRPSWALNWT